MDTQKDLLVQLFESTQALHERFGDEWTLTDALRKFSEETMEFTLEAFTHDTGMSPDCFYEEMIDVLVTMMSCAIRLGISPDGIQDRILYVITKNNAKTHETHERKNGMIVKRSKHG